MVKNSKEAHTLTESADRQTGFRPRYPTGPAASKPRPLWGGLPSRYKTNSGKTSFFIQNWAANSMLVAQMFSPKKRGDKTTKTGSPRALKLRPFEGSSRRGRSLVVVARKGCSNGRGVTPTPGSKTQPEAAWSLRGPWG